MSENTEGLELNLSLSLGSSCADKQKSPLFPLDVMHSLSEPAFGSSSDVNVGTMVEGEEMLQVSSPNSTVSTVNNGKKRCERDGDHEAQRQSTYDENGGDAATRKKLRLSKEQVTMLEEAFKDYNTPDPKHKSDLAAVLNLTTKQVEVWFQNRRARTKLKQTELECEHLKECCKILSEENRRLQKEVNELRVLKLAHHHPQFHHTNTMTPPTTLIMCPQCQHLAISSSSSSTSASSPLPPTAVSSDNHQGDLVGSRVP